ncbi:hypothetical protein DV515_00016586 [Chloebia gouldiae]|uniref:Uncharacterized protein n=1 Tax=Chloebia gouldiae TaxID=44316 RepID=A0A3L8RRL7_CHLGU|nr:hypothetical protein DV515_00016586 [Chloebia gouldiae]
MRRCREYLMGIECPQRKFPSHHGTPEELLSWASWKQPWEWDDPCGVCVLCPGVPVRQELDNALGNTSLDEGARGISFGGPITTTSPGGCFEVAPGSSESSQ